MKKAVPDLLHCAQKLPSAIQLQKSSGCNLVYVQIVIYLLNIFWSMRFPIAAIC